MNNYDQLLYSFDKEKRESLNDLFLKYSLTESQRLIILKASADLELFGLGDIFSFLDFNKVESKSNARKRDEIVRQVESKLHELRYNEIDYSTFYPKAIKREKEAIEPIDSDFKLFGKCPCPVDGEKTRCCKLVTLDAAMQCSFGCSYCSVQAFYSKNKIKVVTNLKERLDRIDLTDIWHIGTGQASDSLILGDTYNTLSDLSEFASKHTDIIIELKSKSMRRDFFNKKYPRNMIFTWSLNAPTIIKKEEHLTASLNERLESAKIARDNGSLVGFHIHPMVYFKGWQEEYKEVVDMIESIFKPSEICQISFGTLTFTKSVLHHLRCNRVPSRVLSIPLEAAAGKYSYSLKIKEEMFKTVYSYFSDSFKKNIFFYLCMEDPSLWPSCLGRSYECDRDFELDMKKHYFEKVNSI